MSREQNLQIHKYNLHLLLKNFVSFVSDRLELIVSSAPFLLTSIIFQQFHFVIFPSRVISLLARTKAAPVGSNGGIRPPVWSAFVLKGPLLRPWDPQRRPSFPAFCRCVLWRAFVCPAQLRANWTMVEPRRLWAANPRPPHPEAQALWHTRKHTCRSRVH